MRGNGLRADGGSRAVVTKSPNCNKSGRETSSDTERHKSEIRISKSETNPKSESADKSAKFGGLGHLNFEFVSDFEIRISDLGLSGRIAPAIAGTKSLLFVHKFGMLTRRAL